MNILILFLSLVQANNLKVSDFNSRPYLGPKNPRRADLSSVILRSKKYFEGSTKPIWYDEAPRFYTVECEQGSTCSKTISWFDENSVAPPKNQNKEILAPINKVTFRPKWPKITKPPIPNWPKVTRKPIFTRKPSSNPFPTQHYDPFAFHRDKVKKRQNPEPAKFETLPISRYENPPISRFDYEKPQFEPRPQFSYERPQFDYERPEVFGPYRSSLTWKNQPQPAMNRREEFHIEEPILRTRKRNSIERNRNPIESKRYFPSSKPPQSVPNLPRRNYFPISQEEEPFPEIPLEKSKFVGQEQVVNAGYIVKESPKVIPNEYLISSYKPEPDLSQWYDLEVETTTLRPKVYATTVKPWTSLELAKPNWDEYDSDSKNFDNKGLTFGAWNQDNLKLSAVPFSRATDGKERKWTKISSIKRKRKKVDPITVYLNENLGSLQVN